MINFEDMKFGDKIYVVKEKNNAFLKRRITMTDENGIEWYRYDRDHWEYEIEEIEYCGRVTYTEEGEVRFNEDRWNEFHFKYPDGQIHPEYDYEDEQIENWFYTLKEAQKYTNKLKDEKNG